MIGQRHSHLCNAGYSYDQKNLTKKLNSKDLVDALITEEKWRQILNSLIICLFARKVFNIDRTLLSLNSMGIEVTETDLTKLANDTYKKKNDWKIAAGQTLSEKRLAERLFKTESPHGYIKREFIKEAIDYYSKLTNIPVV
ncbi:MAG: aldehyde ferredoxin oxidoreductase C-terminal domain-containing protein [Candidatus Heimdallarchaeota archaeon]